MTITGYSLGGENAVQLSNMLGKAGIKVSQLIIIDAAHGPASSSMMIPGNVDFTDNFWQPNQSRIYSRGNPAVPGRGNTPDRIRNHEVLGANHSNIYDIVAPQVKDILRGRLDMSPSPRLPNQTSPLYNNIQPPVNKNNGALPQVATAAAAAATIYSLKFVEIIWLALAFL